MTTIQSATPARRLRRDLSVLSTPRQEIERHKATTPISIPVSKKTACTRSQPLNGGLLEGYMSTVVFAYQGFAGLRYKINENMGLSLEYRYFATTEPEWEADVVFGPAGSDNVRFGRIESHVFSIAFQFRF